MYAYKPVNILINGDGIITKAEQITHRVSDTINETWIRGDWGALGHGVHWDTPYIACI